MSKLLHELTFKEYTALIASGMMYVYYPDCTGSYNKDIEEAHLDLITYGTSVMKDGKHVPLTDTFEWPEDCTDTIGQNGPVGTHYDLELDNDGEQYMFVIDDAANEDSLEEDKPLHEMSLEEYNAEMQRREMRDLYNEEKSQ